MKLFLDVVVVPRVAQVRFYGAPEWRTAHSVFSFFGVSLCLWQSRCGYCGLIDEFWFVNCCQYILGTCMHLFSVCQKSVTNDITHLYIHKILKKTLRKMFISSTSYIALWYRQVNIGNNNNTATNRSP